MNLLHFIIVITDFAKQKRNKGILIITNDPLLDMVMTYL